MLKKSRRLNVSKFLLLSPKPHKIIKYQTFDLFIYKNNEPINKYGVFITKKEIPKSVWRNKIKRTVFNFVKNFPDQGLCFLFKIKALNDLTNQNFYFKSYLRQLKQELDLLKLI